MWFLWFIYLVVDKIYATVIFLMPVYRKPVLLVALHVMLMSGRSILSSDMTHDMAHDMTGGAERRDFLHRTDRVACASTAVGECEQLASRLRGQDAPAAEGTPRRLQAREHFLHSSRRGSSSMPVVATTATILKNKNDGSVNADRT